MLTISVALKLFLITAVVTADRFHNMKLKERNTAAIDPDEKTARFWVDNAQNAINEKINRIQNKDTARNVIMFLGDGMSIPTLAAARALKGQRLERSGEESELSFETFPTVGLAKTYCVDSQVADSACSATAYLCGVKTNDGTIGVTAAVTQGDCIASVDKSTHLESIAAWALKDGRDAGFVTTTRVTHASPAGVYANTANRDWENDGETLLSGVDPYNTCPDIAQQLIHEYPANQFKVILGGGKRAFLPNTTFDEEGRPGRRQDNRNLIEEWKNAKAEQGVSYKYMWNKTEVLDAMASPPEYILGLFEDGHLQYHLQANTTTEPTLTELVELAIKSLSRNEKGFFLFVESGRIDHAHHDNLITLALDETIQLSNAVEKAIELLGTEDTLIVVTSDHAHAMAYNGYSRRGSDILGPSGAIADDNIPFMTLSYTNGPGHRPHVDGARVDVTKEEKFIAKDLTWTSHADVPRYSETHGGDDIAVFAIGPHHHLFTGLYEQSHIPHLMAYIACIGDGQQACTSSGNINIIGPMILFIVTIIRFFSF